jgi:hypothetical protein
MNNLSINKKDAQKHYLKFGQKNELNPHPIVNTKFIILNCWKEIDIDSDLWELYKNKSKNPKEIKFSPHPLFDFKYYENEQKMKFLNINEAVQHYFTHGWLRGIATSGLHQEYLNLRINSVIKLHPLDLYTLIGNYLMDRSYLDDRLFIDSERLLELKSRSELYDFIKFIKLASSEDNSRR